MNAAARFGRRYGKRMKEGVGVTQDQYTRTEEALVAAIERAETSEAIIKLTELLMDFQRQTPTADRSDE